MNIDKVLKLIYAGVILIGIACFVFYILPNLKGCKHDPPMNDTILQVDTVPGDSVPYPVTITVTKPYPVYVTNTDTLWKYQDVDTLAILQAYFETRHYDEILMNDTSAYIRLLSHVYKNELYFDSLYFQNKRATIINNYTVLKYQRGIFAGVTASNLCLAPSIYYADKQWLIGMGYDIRSKEPIFNVAYKIKSYKQK